MIRTDRIVLNAILCGLLVGVFSSYLGLVGLMVAAIALGFVTAFSDNKRTTLTALGSGLMVAALRPPDVLTLLLGAGWGGFGALLTFTVFAAIGWLIVRVSTVQ